jgi:uncharacterized membrane protein
VIAEHFTRRWQNAGLIDAEAARRIVAWEASHRSPIWLWAVAGLGALAIALGIMAIVGANWESIPFWAKLAVDLALNAACAAFVFVFWRAGRAWPRDISALLLFGLVLSGIALIGQVYQLQSEAWQALVLWLALSTPFLALTAFTRMNGMIWTIAVVTTWFVADDPVYRVLAHFGVLPLREEYWRPSDVVPVLAYLPACGMVVVAAMRGLWPPAQKQADVILKLGLAGLILQCSLVTAFPWHAGGDKRLLGPIVAAAVATFAAGIACWLARVPSGRVLVITLLGMSFAAWTAAALVANSTGMAGDFARALLFIVYWAALGFMAARAGWRGLFGLAFAVIGLRLLVLYFEAIGGLTATGLGLLGGGVICLVLAAVGWRLIRGVPRQTTGTGAGP